jgi:hypothetical protein
VIALLLIVAAFAAVIWFTSELPELWIGAIVLIPIIQTLI